MSRPRSSREMERPGPGEASRDLPVRLAKGVGVLAIMASAVSQEYGSGINFVMTNSIGAYPQIGRFVPLAMFAAGLLLLPNVVMFGRFGSVMPKAGSTYVWLTRSTGLFIGFLVAFLWFIGIVAAIGFLAFSFPVFVQGLYVLLGGSGTWLVSVSGHLVIGLALIWLIFLLHMTGVRNYGFFVILIFAIVLFAALSTIYFSATTSHHTFLAKATAEVGHALQATPAGPLTPGIFFAVVTLFMFSYGGLAAATSLGGEARKAEKSIPRGIWYAWGTALILYTLISLLIFHAVPFTAVRPLITSGHSALATTPGLIGLVAPAGMGAAINIAIVLIIGKTVAPEMLDSSRYLFAWAQDGLIPKLFLHVNRKHAPDVALIVSAVFGSLFLLEATFFGFQVGVILRSMSLVLVFGVLGIGVLNLRLNPRYRTVGWARQISRHPTVLVAAVLGIIIAIVLEFSVLVVPGEPLLLEPSSQAVIAIIIAGVLYYLRREHTVGAVDETTGALKVPVE